MISSRRDGYCHDDLARAFLAERFDGGAHRRSCRQAIVDEDYRVAFDIRRGSPIAVQSFASLELALLGHRHSLDCVRGDAVHLNELPIKYPHPAGGDRTHRQLFVAREAKFSNEEDIQRSMERAGNLVGYRHAASRQRQNQ